MRVRNCQAQRRGTTSISGQAGLCATDGWDPSDPKKKQENRRLSLRMDPVWTSRLKSHIIVERKKQGGCSAFSILAILFIRYGLDTAEIEPSKTFDKFGKQFAKLGKFLSDTHKSRRVLT